MVHSNSLQAFNQLIESGDRDNLMVKVYMFILKNPCCTIYDIEKGLKISRITAGARLSELQDLGVVKTTLPKIVGNRKVSTYFVQQTPLKIDLNAKLRRELKMQKCVERLINQFGDLLPEEIYNNLNTFYIYGNDI